MKKVTSFDGVNLVYTIEGQGVPIIMIHGIDGNLAAFNDLKAELSSRYQVISYDVRGHGKSSKPNAYNLEDHLEDLNTLMERLNIKQAHILGHGMGGLIASGFVSKYTRKVLSLTMLSVHFNEGISGLNRLMIEHQDEVKGFNKFEAQLILFSHIYYQEEPAMKWFQAQRVYHKQTAEHSAIASRAMMTCPPNFKTSIDSNANVPTLIIFGRHDPLVNHDMQRDAYKDNNDVTIEIFENSGHAPHVEELDHFLDSYDKFLHEIH